MGTWLDPFNGEREIGNSHDPQAMAIKKEIIGHH